MIGQKITDDKGNPLESLTKAPSMYAPPPSVMALFAQVQKDFQVAWNLQHRGLEEFDGHSLLERARLDQQTFAAYVGIEWQPAHKKWRWKGRKNTARNKLIGILAHMLSGMLFPYVYAKNEQNEEDKMTARVMRIMVEDALKNSNGKRGYEVTFLFMVLSALVNPATFVEVEYVMALQTIKGRLANGDISIKQAVDQILSGLNLNVLAIDQVLLGDLYSGTGEIQRLGVVFKQRRIPYDQAKKIHGGKYFYGGRDLMDFVSPGMTHCLFQIDGKAQLFDVPWTESDPNYVHELTAYYRDEDLQLTWVGGVGLFNYDNPYNSNPFEHRRLSLIKDTTGKEEWCSIPIVPIAMSGFEPIDPTGRFAYYKSGAFKEYWDALSQDKMHQLAHDGTYLDVIKPLFLSGVAKADSTVMAPGATVAMPMGSTVTPYQLGPNLAAAMNMMALQKSDISESTQDPIMQGKTDPNVTAYATQKAEQNARIFMQVFGVMTARLISDVGALAMDCIVQHETIGELDASVPEALAMKYKTHLVKTKEKGQNVTNKIFFTDKYMGRKLTDKQKNDIEIDLYKKAGGEDSDQLIWEVNPYRFARTIYTMGVDADLFVMRSTGMDQKRKVLAHQMLTQPTVYPYTDPEAVANDVIDEFGGDDPDRLKRKGNSNDMLSSIMGPGGPGGASGGAVVPPVTAAVAAG